MADAAPLTLRDRRDEFTRRAILAAARELLAGDPAALSLRAVARAVGYSPAALYRYYDSKEALLAALRDEGWALLAAFAADALPDPAAPDRAAPDRAAPDDLLAAYVGRILRFAAAHPQHYRLMVAALDAPPLPVAAWRADPPTARLIAALEAAAAAGRWDAGGQTAEQVVFRAWLLAHGAALLRPVLLRNDRAWDVLLADLRP